MFTYTLLISMLMAAPPPSPPTTAHATVEHDKVQLTMSPRITIAGGGIRAIVRVDRHADNRLLRVTIEGPDFASSTERQLDGEDSARTYEMAWQTLPGGEYVATVEVDGNKGVRHLVTQRFSVIGGAPNPADAAQPSRR